MQIIRNFKLVCNIVKTISTLFNKIIGIKPHHGIVLDSCENYCNSLSKNLRFTLKALLGYNLIIMFPLTMVVFCVWETRTIFSYYNRGPYETVRFVSYLAYCCFVSVGTADATWLRRCCWSLWNCCSDRESPFLCSGSSSSCNAEWNFSPAVPASPDGTLRHLNAAAAPRPRLRRCCLQGLLEICNVYPFCFNFLFLTTQV